MRIPLDRIVACIGAAACFMFLSPGRLFAADFRADYDVTYAVPSEGKPTVIQTVTLTNLQSTYYPRQYTVTIDSDKISDVTAYDSIGSITPTIVVSGGKTAIAVKFNEHVVGNGKSMTFSLRYMHESVARKIGSIWEIHIPGIIPDETIGDYKVHLQTSPALGPLAYFSPRPENGKDTWVKEQLVHGGIVAAYGTVQSYVANITYPLENPSQEPVMQEIAVPPDTAYQKVTVVSMDPKPTSMEMDRDGNWIARFRLAPAETLNVKAKLNIAVRAIPEDKTTSLTDEKIYLSEQKYWETSDPGIKAVAEELGANPRAIYDYVVSTLSYDYDAALLNPNRKGAKLALVKPNESVCREFTDLFIAIARAAGIPAREVVGYGYTDNEKLRPLSVESDVLHAWPQYYDNDLLRWIDVDPTWGHTTGGVDYFTTFDFNHIAFVVRGVKSDYPYPAGSYQNGSVPKKNVQITFAEYQAQELPEGITIQFAFPPSAKAGKTYSGSVVIQNVSGQILQTANIRIDGYPYQVSITKEVSAIPPMGSITIPVTIPISNWLERRSGKLLVTVNGQSREYQFSVQPMYWVAIPVVGLVFAGIVLWSITKKH